MGIVLNDLEVVELVAGICATSATAAELCRKLVHSPELGEDAVGAAVYMVTQVGDLELVGSYGNTPLFEDDASVWSDNPVAVVARTQIPTICKVNSTKNGEVFAGVIPILKGTEPIGVITILRTDDKASLAKKLSTPAIRALANTLGLWLDSLGLKSTTGPIAQVGSEELTTRQLDVLKQMASGKTNAEIAAEMILSESSIRQETVRIYRSLGVSSRSEAARKALNLGLLEKISI